MFRHVYMLLKYAYDPLKVLLKASLKGLRLLEQSWKNCIFLEGVCPDLEHDPCSEARLVSRLRHDSCPETRLVSTVLISHFVQFNCNLSLAYPISVIPIAIVLDMMKNKIWKRLE